LYCEIGGRRSGAFSVVVEGIKVGGDDDGTIVVSIGDGWVDGTIGGSSVGSRVDDGGIVGQ
jgi:hypothetical protein